MFMEMTLVGWLVFEISNSAWQVAFIAFCRSAPVPLSGFFSGSVAGRFGRLRVLRVSQAAVFATYAAMAWLLWAEALDMWHIGASAVLLGTSWGLSWTTRRALVPDLVGKRQTVDAMLLENLAQNVSRIAGPFAAGTAIETTGATGCYTAIVVIAALSLAAVLCVSGRGLPPARPPQTSPWKLMADGLRYFRGNQPIMGDLLITVAMNFLAFPYMAMLPVFARDILHRGPVGLGLLGAASGVGSFIGLLGVTQARRAVSPGWIFGVGSTLMGIALVAFAFSTDFYLSLGLLLLSGVGQACFSVMQSAIVLITATDDMRDRAMGAVAIAIGAGPPGRLQLGVLAESLGAPLALGITAASAAMCVVAVTAALPGFRARLVEEPDPQQRESGRP